MASAGPEELIALLGLFTHDVRNLVASMQANTRTVLDDPGLGEDARAAATDLEDLCTAMARGVQNLDALFPGEPPRHRDSVAVPALVTAAVDGTSGLARLHEVSVEVDHASLAGLETTAHREWLDLCLYDLLANAMAYSTGRAPVRIRAESDPVATRLHLEDDGPSLLGTLGPGALTPTVQRQAHAKRGRYGRTLGLLGAAAAARLGGATVELADTPSGNRVTLVLLPGRTTPVP